jgi:hypothetical protein
MFKKLLLTSSIAAVLIGCGGGGSSSSSSSTGAATPQTVNGTVSAPSGAVALLEQKNLFEIAQNMLTRPVAAAVIGLDPVTGANVELIRIDDNGTQIGEVLATTTTSITGDYTLTLPEGTNLSGDLIVRISGTGGTEMRAQVVSQQVNISPVSEFVLKKFIDDGVDLDSLTTTAVIKLSGQVEEFDLSATHDMSSMLALLEAEVGDFVESNIGVITSTALNASDISGNYRSAALELSLHDSDGQGLGTFGTDLWSADFIFSGNSNGTVNITLQKEESAWSNLTGSDGSWHHIDYYPEIDNETETFSAILGSDKVLTVEGEFEEDIDGDYGWRSPPTIYRLQKVRDQNIFFHTSQEASVRYSTIDTNGDGVKDAIDPSAREGDEVFRGLEVFYKQPSAMTNADLNGSYGRVYMNILASNNGYIELETEHSKVEFDGNGMLNAGEADAIVISRSTNGPASVVTETVPAENGLTIAVAADGDITSIEGAPADGFVNDNAELIVFAESEGTDAVEAAFSTTLLLKLPGTAPSIANKRYRLMFLSTYFDNQAIGIDHSRFNSHINWSSNTEGTASINSGSIFTDSLQAEVEAENAPTLEVATSASIATNGETTISLNDGSGDFTLTGFLNASGSLGVFTTTYQEDGAANPDTIGMAVLIEVDAQ